MSKLNVSPTPYLSLKVAALFPLLFIALLWLLKLIEVISGLSLTGYGVYPGKISGLPGIILAPLIHGSFAHLVANTLPILVLGTSMTHTYPRSARPVFVSIYLISGLGVWLFARPAYHFGASGLNYGMMFFIFVIGILRRDRLPIALSMLVFFLYGSMIYGIFPQDPAISFEYHFFGAMTGIVLAFIMKSRDPKPPEKTYDWENEPEEEDDPVIGDEWREKE